jgi:hypothetical protein
MDPARGRDQLRNDPQARDRAQDAAQRGDRERAGNLDQNRAEGLNRDRAGAADRNFSRETQRARGNNDSAFRDAGDAQRTRQQVDRGNASRQQMSQRGGARAGGGGRRR